ncbi:unnamed protein product [Ilex paraguariensis]|uniref:GATA-type domain-containing protein n=1 Tax=Ilex paraguariensis TaxID=185542 RepID=A0ABC8UG58_9AQUA
MTPVYLNPSPSSFPFVELGEDQHLEQLTTPQQASSPLTCPLFFNSQDQRGSHPAESKQKQQKVDRYILHSGSSDQQVISFSSVKLAQEDSNGDHKFSGFKREVGDERKNGEGSMKWMSSKMRLMRKMMNSNYSGTDKPVKVVEKFNQDNSETMYAYNSNKDNVRVCSDCNTTKTPLWRSGPQGPKSLCNACGIRQRKARQAFAAHSSDVANGSSVMSKVNNKEKKTRTSYVKQLKKPSKHLGSPHRGKELSLEDFDSASMGKTSAFGRVLPQEEEEAAILLMALSSDLINS